MKFFFKKLQKFVNFVNLQIYVNLQKFVNFTQIYKFM